MNNKDIALSYLRKGLSVIPLKSPSMVRRDLPEQEFIRQCKMPLVSWKEYQSRRPTEAEVAGWFEKWPYANIGIVTGAISNLVVFDLDSKTAVEYAEKNGGFPKTPMAETGKGLHAYVQRPNFEVGNAVDTDLGIDIRGQGGYVAAPPSIHGNGNQYSWVEGFSIHDIDPASCNPWMLDYLKRVEQPAKPKTTKEKPLKPSDSAKSGSTARGSDPYADILVNGAPEGMRNDTAARLIGHYLAKGLAATEAWELVKTWNAGKNKPALSEPELLKTFESIRESHAKNADTPKEETIIEVDRFLDTSERVTAEYSEQYVRVPFCGGLLPTMQSKMNGGLVGGRTYVLGGIPSSGKTVLTNNIADNICLEDYPVLFFSYDDGRAELRYRTYCRFSSYDIEAFNQQQIAVDDLQAILANKPIRKITALKYVVKEVYKIDDWHKILDQIIGRTTNAPVIIVDFLRKLTANDLPGEERHRVNSLLSKLTDLAKSYNIPILVISEIGRDSYKFGQRINMASFKESGSIEYEASWLGILTVADDGNGNGQKEDWERIINHDGNIDLIVFKAKRGTGAAGKIALKLDKAKMTVRDRIEATRHDSVTPLTNKSKYA